MIVISVFSLQVDWDHSCRSHQNQLRFPRPALSEHRSQCPFDQHLALAWVWPLAFEALKTYLVPVVVSIMI